MKVIVIGAGPSGIVAAIRASKNNDVILIDSNKVIGKKLLLTGNGKCNYWNKFISSDKYLTDSPSILEEILNKGNIDNTFKFLTELGLYPVIKDNLYYPYSNSSQSVLTIFKGSLEKSHVTFIDSVKIKAIEAKNDRFLISGENDFIIEGDKLIIATGSKAMPKTGSDGSMFDILNNLNHDIVDVTPSLTRINLNCNFKDIANIRCHARVSVLVDDEVIYKDTGEVHLTDKGISGIVSFNASAYVSKYLNKGKKVSIAINYLNDIMDVSAFLESRAELLNNPKVSNMLESLFNYKLMYYLLKVANINPLTKWNSLSPTDKNNLIAVLTNNTYEVLSTDDFDNSQVCLGGVSLTNINSKTFESLKVKNLYIVGEALDVAGLCGGFNLAFAFISGYIVGGCI